MAVYTPQQLGIKPPAGGFLTGGWYNARQYWNGTLSDPGVIHPESNQQGAGSAVNPAVVAQSNPDQGLKPGTNEAYIASQWANNPKPTIANTDSGYLSGSGATAGGGSVGGGGTGLNLSIPQSTIDLPSIYQNLFNTSGITDDQNQLANLESQYLEARNKISDNPFLNASMVDKRLARLEGKYNQQINPLRDKIAMKKADIETQLNLQMKQFDLNSQSARDALNLFNTLLEAGALTSASGEDIANFTRMTGIPSSMIQSAISTQSKKNVETQLITSTADSGVVTATLVNTQTGEVIKQTNLGNIGNAQTGSADRISEAEATRMIRNDLISEAQAGATWDAIHELAVMGGIDERDAYSIYSSMGIYHPDSETQISDLKRYGISQTGYTAY